MASPSKRSRDEFEEQDSAGGGSDGEPAGSMMDSMMDTISRPGGGSDDDEDGGGSMMDAMSRPGGGSGDDEDGGGSMMDIMERPSLGAREHDAGPENATATVMEEGAKKGKEDEEEVEEEEMTAARAESLLRQPDALMGPGVAGYLQTWCDDGGDPKEAAKMLAAGYRGFPAMAKLVAAWLDRATDAAAAASGGGGGGGGPASPAAAVGGLAAAEAGLISRLSIKLLGAFDPGQFDGLLDAEASGAAAGPPAWLISMLADKRWHKLFAGLAEKYRGSLLLGFAQQVIEAGASGGGLVAGEDEEGEGDEGLPLEGCLLRLTALLEAAIASTAARRSADCGGVGGEAGPALAAGARPGKP